MDVHKDIIVATIGITEPSTLITDYIQETFGTLNPELQRLVSWLKDHDCTDVCMESTGKYWIPPYNVLEDAGITICLAHPKYTKAIKGKKTDKKDSKWICDLYKCDLVKSSYIPPKDIRQLREISRYYHKLVNIRSSEYNRYQNCMTISNIGLGSVFTDPFGKSAQKVMAAVLESDTNEYDRDEILKLVHKGCKKKDKIMDAINGSVIESDARFKMKTIQKHKEELDELIDDCLVEMFVRAAKYANQFHHITEIPGISDLSATLIVAEIGVDMEVWESGKQLACWAGLTPGNNESANKKKSTRITRAGQYLKPLLVQCALAALKEKDGCFTIKYNRIKKRRGHKRALIAIARMMLISIYHMIKDGETFNPYDYEELMNPKPSKAPEPVYTVDTAIEYLKSQGVDLAALQEKFQNSNAKPLACS
jgi:transposase